MQIIFLNNFCVVKAENLCFKATCVVDLTDILTYKVTNLEHLTFDNLLREADRGFFLPDSFILSENASNECSFIKIGGIIRR